LVIERDGRARGLMPLYMKSHSQGEYVFDWGWADAFERAGGEYYPKLQASVPFTPVTGSRLLIACGSAEDAEETRRALLSAGASAVSQLNASSLHITFLTKDEWQAASARGFLQRMDQQFHWRNRAYSSFNDFLADLSSSKRKTLRKERAAVFAEGVEFEWLAGRDITEAHWDEFFTFYMDTGSRKWGQPYLTREFFSRVGESMGEQIVLIRKGGLADSSFGVEAQRFYLFPTNYHDAGGGEPTHVPITHWAEVVRTWQIRDVALLERLESLTVLGRDVIDTRYRFRPDQAINVIAVRAYRLAQAVNVAMKPEYAGCRRPGPPRHPSGRRVSPRAPAAPSS
jgi:hypothetical protein